MTKLITPETEKALTFPVGMASPLWLMFAGAAAAGAAMFWARAWFKPTNLEAVLAPLPEPDPGPDPIVEAVEDAVMLAVETRDAMVEVAAEVIETAAEASAEVVEDAVEAVEDIVETLADAAPQAVEATAPVVDAVADDLTRLTGIGPKLAERLAERGVTRFADIAAWTPADVEAFDKDMKLMGRIDREAWIAQARRFATA